MKTVTEVRHQKLLELIEQAGSVQAFATKVGASHSQISQLKTQAKHSNTGKPRTIGNDLARRIEAAFGLAPGWMDSLPTEGTVRIEKYSLQPAEPRLACEEIPPWWPFPMIDKCRIDALPERLKGSLEVSLLDLLERLERLAEQHHEPR